MIDASNNGKSLPSATQLINWVSNLVKQAKNYPSQVMRKRDEISVNWLGKQHMRVFADCIYDRKE